MGKNCLLLVKHCLPQGGSSQLFNVRMRHILGEQMLENYLFNSIIHLLVTGEIYYYELGGL